MFTKEGATASILIESVEVYVIGYLCHVQEGRREGDGSIVAHGESKSHALLLIESGFLCGEPFKERYILHTYLQ